MDTSIAYFLKQPNSFITNKRRTADLLFITESNNIIADFLNNTESLLYMIRCIYAYKRYF